MHNKKKTPVFTIAIPVVKTEFFRQTLESATSQTFQDDEIVVVNNAKNLVFLVTGKDKAKVAKAILEDKDITLPASRIRPFCGKLFWLFDKDASTLLSF